MNESWQRQRASANMKATQRALERLLKEVESYNRSRAAKASVPFND